MLSIFHRLVQVHFWQRLPIQRGGGWNEVWDMHGRMNGTTTWLAAFGEERVAPVAATSSDHEHGAVLNTSTACGRRALNLVQHSGMQAPVLAQAGHLRV